MGEQNTEVDLQHFVEMIGLNNAAPERYSILLALQLLGGALSGVQNPAKVIREIQELEAGLSGQLKAPIQNRHPPLKGLWHKHYMQDGLSSLAMNVQKGLSKYGMPFFEQKIQEAKDAGEERFLSPDDVPALVSDIVRGNRERLAEAQAITGEWLVFAKHEGKNYYLCVTTHDKSTHDHLRKQIDEVCCKEFPFLANLLAEA